ncbi:hypothetical protein V3C99_016850 [Haemonchus contortus]
MIVNDSSRYSGLLIVKSEISLNSDRTEMSLHFLVFLALFGLVGASLRLKRHSSSQGFGDYSRNEAMEQQERWSRQANMQQYYGPYYSFNPYYSQYSSNQYYQQYYQPAIYRSYSQYNYPSRYYGNSQSSGGGLLTDRWGNRYVMLGSLRINVTCKSRGCPGKK